MRKNINKSLVVLAMVVVALLFATQIIAYSNKNATIRISTSNFEDSLLADTLDEDTTTQSTDSIENITKLPWPQNIQARIDKLLKSNIFETSTVGLMIYDLSADSTLYKYNEKQLMRPASTLKMMVAIAALDKLGCNYRYRTTMETTAKLDSNTLRGDLYFLGGFDPMIDNGDLSVFIDSLHSLGIDTIQGDIIADKSMKDKDLLGEGWCWDDDNPVLSPLTAGRKDDFTDRFLSLLKKSGIVHYGQIRTATSPHSAHPLCVIERPIDEVMHKMLKESDNFYSESMFYQLAAQQGGTATARAGRNQMNRLINRLGFKPSHYYIADGSGLSLYNYVSPELEVAFLRYAYTSNCIFTMLMQHMPIAGIDGTLRERMRHGHAYENVHAKTGTVTGVSSLAGYCTAANGHRLCFAIINMGIRHASSGRRFQDRVCEALCQ